MKLLPWKKAGSDQLLGQGLKLQVGNVTECALLGLLEELSELVESSLEHRVLCLALYE